MAKQFVAASFVYLRKLPVCIHSDRGNPPFLLLSFKEPGNDLGRAGRVSAMQTRLLHFEWFRDLQSGLG